MKKYFKVVVFFAIFLLIGCGKANQSSEDTITDKKEETIDPLDGYKENNSSEKFDETVTFKLIGDVIYKEPSNQYCNTNEDGTIDLYLDVTDGTPYNIEGVIYDHEMFSMKMYGKYIAGDQNEVGGGVQSVMYRFTPLRAGESDIAALNEYITDGLYEGTVYTIVVDENLQCSLIRYGRVIEGENIEIHEQ